MRQVGPIRRRRLGDDAGAPEMGQMLGFLAVIGLGLWLFTKLGTH